MHEPRGPGPEASTNQELSGVPGAAWSRRASWLWALGAGSMLLLPFSQARCRCRHRAPCRLQQLPGAIWCQEASWMALLLLSAVCCLVSAGGRWDGMGWDSPALPSPGQQRDGQKGRWQAGGKACASPQAGPSSDSSCSYGGPQLQLHDTHWAEGPGPGLLSLQQHSCPQAHSGHTEEARQA